MIDTRGLGRTKYGRMRGLNLQRPLEPREIESRHSM